MTWLVALLVPAAIAAAIVIVMDCRDERARRAERMAVARAAELERAAALARLAALEGTGRPAQGDTGRPAELP